MTEEQVIEVLRRLGIIRSGLPLAILPDKVRFASRALGPRADVRGLRGPVHRTWQTEPERFMENFKRASARKLLSEHVFTSLDDARRKAEA